MFGRSERKTPFQREQNQKLENLRDDCIALFINSGLTQKQIHERGGPTPTTISKWLYGETHFPRYASIEAFLLALGHELMPVSSAVAAELRNKGRNTYLNIDVAFAGKPRMPKKGPKRVTSTSSTRHDRAVRYSGGRGRRTVARR
jgi:hypothetical protein